MARGVMKKYKTTLKSARQVTEPRWITKEQTIRMHAEQLAVLGGPAGLRDEGMLESALNRPRSKWAFGEADLAVLVAAYALAWCAIIPSLMATSVRLHGGHDILAKECHCVRARSGRGHRGHPGPRLTIDPLRRRGEKGGRGGSSASRSPPRRPPVKVKPCAAL